MGNFFNCKKVIDPSKIVNMPKDKKQEESEETEEYETYEYETETGEEEETSSGEEESSEEGETESSEEEETSSGEEESSSGEGEEEEKEESSEYEYETSEYESEYETESSEQKPAAAAAAATPAAAATSEPAKSTPPAKAAAAAAAPAQARVIVQAEEREVLQHGEQEHEWAPKRFLAEFIGTFALCWGIYMTRGNVKDVNGLGVPSGELVGVALVHAFVLAAMAASFGQISGGHFNPAVTVTFTITRQVNWAVGLIYIVVQCAAAVLAGALTWGLLPEPLTDIKPGTHWAAPISCGKFPNIDLPEETRFDGTCPYRAFGAEIFGTAFLIITVFLSGVAGHGADSAYIAIGMSLGFGVLATGPISNACLNPARALGSAAFAHKYDWSHFWVWVIGPFIASIVVALIFGLVFQAPWDKSKGSHLLKRD